MEPAPATELELPDLEGNRVRLSEFQGRWVLLTFFASWCGPCRMEMPSLQQIDEQLAPDGFRVVGVSIDDTAQKAARFARQLGVRFPVLWDERGFAAQAYHASSIPLSYLIDPRGRVVGVARGARDWSQARPTLASLLERETPPELEPAYGEEPVELAASLTPPTAQWSLEPGPRRPEEPFHLDLRVEWAGTLQDYLLHPPEITLPDGIEQTGLSAESTSREGRSVLSYRVALRGRQAGLFDLDPIELRYTPAFEQAPIAVRIAGPTVEIVPRTVLGMSPATAALGAGGILGTGLALWGLLAARRRRDSAETVDVHAELRESFEAARRLRLEGDLLGFLEALAELHRRLAPEEPADEALAELLEQVRYGGVTPPPQELDYRQRALQRRIEQLRTPAATASRIRFRAGEGSRTSVHHARGNSR